MMQTHANEPRCCVWAGAPSGNPWLYRVAPFHAHDAAALIKWEDGAKLFIVRDIEVSRATRLHIAEDVQPPGAFAPEDGLSPDRDIATAQATAAALKRKGVAQVWTDRSLPMVFAHEIMQAGITLRCDPMLGVLERRQKSEREIAALKVAQRKTEQAIEQACQWIANATARADGALEIDDGALTSERVRAEINIMLLHAGMDTCASIVAGGGAGADCHNVGAGALKTGQPIIIDVFPMDPSSHYFGDCTRTVVHGGEGNIPDDIRVMHTAVVEAKAAATSATRAGVTGEAVHEAACEVFRARGYAIGLADESATDEERAAARYVHGTGHGVGLDVHEPPLLDKGGPELLVGDALTIEPGLYQVGIGGVRVEDMVIVQQDGCDNCNSIPEGLTWL